MMTRDTIALDDRTQVDKARRAGDTEAARYLQRADEVTAKKAPMDTSTQVRHAVANMAVVATSAYGFLSSHNWQLQAVSGMIAGAGYAPELLAKLYSSSPEVRTTLLKCGTSTSHMQFTENYGKLVGLLTNKSEEKKTYENQSVKEGEKPKEMPFALKNFEHPKEQENVTLPSEVEASGMPLPGSVEASHLSDQPYKGNNEPEVQPEGR